MRFGLVLAFLLALFASFSAVADYPPPRVAAVAVASVPNVASVPTIAPTAVGCNLDTYGPTQVGGLALIGGGALSLHLFRRRRRVMLGSFALMLAACSTTQLNDCTIQVSRSDPTLDSLICADHSPIKLKNIEPHLRAKLLEVDQ